MAGWPIVGRRRELSQLTGALAAKRGAVITGPPGVGKTTLALSGVEWAQQHGMVNRRVQATRSAQHLPFGVFAPLLPPEPSGTVHSRDDLGVLVGRYCRSIVEQARGLPLVVFVDDAHLLDNGSAILVQQMAQTQAATVLATVRAGEPPPDPVLSLWKDGPAERIEIGVLADAAIEELLVAALAGPVDAATVQELAGRSRGNPMFLRELVNGALNAGTLVDTRGLWRLQGPLSPTVRLVELVAERLGNLTQSERSVLELLALGEPLGPAELARLSDPQVVDALEDKALITSGMQGNEVEMRLAHPVYGDVVRAGISARRLQAISRSLSSVIEAIDVADPVGTRRQDPLRVATLRLAGGGGSAHVMLSGAMVARARHEYFLTERLARAAIDAGAGFEARLVAAEAAHLQGRHDQAEKELGALAAQAATDAEKARVALLRFDNVYWKRSAGLQIIDDALAVITDQSWRDALKSRRLYASAMSSGPRERLEAASSWGQRPDPASRYAVLQASVFMGRLDEAIDELPSPSDPGAFPAPDEPWHEWMLAGQRVAALVYSGRFGEADERLARAYGKVMDHPAAEARALVTACFALLHLEQGRPVSAFRRASESYALLQQLGRSRLHPLMNAFAAHALALSGQAERAAMTLATLDDPIAPISSTVQTDVLQARAWAAVAAGDLPTARAVLEQAANLGEEIGHLVGAASALHGLARLGRAGSIAARLDQLASQIDGELVAARAAFANGAAARDSQALHHVSQAFERIGANLYAAEASVEAATLLRGSGRPRDATAHDHRAAELLARCEGAVTPIVKTIGARARLTPGELDSALQAAAGRSNKQIAADSHVSVRTVESHLQRVYEKLGISNRRELADVLRGQLGT